MLLHFVSKAIGHLENLLSYESHPLENEVQNFIDTAQDTVQEFILSGDKKEFWDSCIELHAITKSNKSLADINERFGFWTFNVEHEEDSLGC